MTIQLRVLHAQARRAYAEVQADHERYARAAVTQNNALSRSFDNTGLRLTKWGSQVQWAGRQLTYNFTLPLAVAGTAATKFALDNERAMVRVSKVYGDTSFSASMVTNEVNALSEAFVALSNHFGVNQAEVIGVAGDWAAAGSSGIALAKAVKLTMETMVLGEIDAVKATESLIAIQAQYGLTVDELSQSIDTLNMVENETGATMGDLIDSMARSAGVARSAGIDVQHLAAMTAALVPASGTASAAGNGLKTIISRLLSPTAEAAEVMGLMGINTADMAWNSLNGVQRLEAMAESFKNLGSAQRATVSATIASRWQINRFDVLMRDVTNSNGYYQKALNATANAEDNLAQRQKELNAVLESNPQKMQQMWVILQNAMAEVIQPLLPTIIMLAQMVANLATAFANLDPVLQRYIILGAAVLAAIGLVGRYVGATAVLFGMFARAASFGIGALVAFTSGMGKFVTLPFTAAAAGIKAISGAVGTAAGVTATWGATSAGAMKAAAGSIGADAAYVSGVVGEAASRVRVAGKVTGDGFVIMSMNSDTAWTRIMNVVRALRVDLPVSMQQGAAAATEGGAAMARGISVPLAAAEASAATSGAAAGRAFSAGVIGLIASATPGVSAAGAATGRAVAISFAEGYYTTAAAEFGVLFSSILAKLAAIPQIAATTGVATGDAFARATSTALVASAPAMASAGSTLARTFNIGFVQASAYTAPQTAAAGAAMGATLAIGASSAAPAAAAAGAALGTATSTGFLARLRVGLLAGIALMARGLVTAIGVLAINLGRAILTALTSVAGFLVSPWGIAIVAVITLFVAFRDDVVRIFNSVVDAFKANSDGIATAFAPVVEFFHAAVQSIHTAFNSLPKAVQAPIMAVVNFIADAAMAVYEWFGYLNPFQRHSPSLVESVTNGMAIVKKQYKSVGNVGAVFGKAAADLKAYKTLASSLSFDEWSGERADVSQMLPSGIGLFNALVADLVPLNRLLAEQNDLVSKQEAVVDGWKSKVDAANAALDAQQSILDKLQDRLDSLQARYNEHEQAMNNYASAGITGQRAMSDAIFDNEQAQKRLRLEIMKIEDAGGSIDDIRNRMSALQGEIETLRGNANDLRAAGAGSDVLGPINAQIDAMEAAYRQMGQSANNSPINQLQDQLEELQRQGEMLDLENSLQFDGLERQIDQLVNGMNEMPYDKIIAGITAEKAAMDKLQPSIDAASAAVKSQQANVDSLTASRDALSSRYDTESAKLKVLQDDYNATRDAIAEVEEALRMVSSAAQKANSAAASAAGAAADKLSPGAQNFLDTAGANFADVGGFANIGREGGLEDQSAEIEKWAEDLANETASALGSIDMFAPVREKWNSFKGWWNQNVVPAWSGLTGGIGESWRTMGEGLSNAGVPQAFDTAWQAVKDFWNSAKEFFGWLGELFGPQLKEIWDQIVEASGPAFEKLKAAWENMAPIFKGIGDVLGVLWLFIKNVFLPLIGGVLVSVLSMAFSVIGNTIGTIIDFISTVISNIVQFIRGFVDVVAGIFTGDFGRVLDGFSAMIGALWSTVVAIFEGAWDLIYGIVSGLVEGVVDLFQWLWDTVVGEKIAGMWNAIVSWFGKIWDDGVKKVSGMVSAVSTYWENLRLYIIMRLAMLLVSALQKWDEIKKGISDRARAIWEGLLERFQNIYDGVSKKISSLRDTVSTIFNAMKDLILRPFNYVKDKIGGIFDDITDSIKGGINKSIGGVNKLILGLNKVSDMLPGLDWNISTIPMLAQGGAIPSARVGAGFKTNGARAIVGEGNRLHPEYVVPTDPAYRKRASELYQELGSKLGMSSDSPEWGIGGIAETVKGWIGSGASLAQSGMDWIQNAAQGAVSTIFRPIKSAAEGLIAGIPWTYGKQMAQSGLDQVWGWVTGADESYRRAAGEVGGNGPWRKPLSSYTKTSNYGMRVNPVTGAYRLHAGVDLAAPMGQAIYAAAQGAVKRITSASGLGNHVKIDHGAGLSTVYGHMSAFAGKIGNVMAGDLIGKIGSTGNSTGPHLHFEVRRNGSPMEPLDWMRSKGVQLAEGAIVRARSGGTLATIGEGRHDEAVIPLPGGYRAALAAMRNASLEPERIEPRGNYTHNEYHFHGDLSFPNIRSGEDADEFMKNLSDLAGGK